MYCNSLTQGRYLTFKERFGDIVGWKNISIFNSDVVTSYAVLRVDAILNIFNSISPNFTFRLQIGAIVLAMSVAQDVPAFDELIASSSNSYKNVF